MFPWLITLQNKYISYIPSIKRDYIEACTCLVINCLQNIEIYIYSVSYTIWKRAKSWKTLRHQIKSLNMYNTDYTTTLQCIFLSLQKSTRNTSEGRERRAWTSLTRDVNLRMTWRAHICYMPSPWDMLSIQLSQSNSEGHKCLSIHVRLTL